MMKRLLISGFSVALSFSFALPSFAYVFRSQALEVPERTTRRSIESHARAMNSRERPSIVRERQVSAPQRGGRSRLSRSHDRQFRRYNRQPKIGHDRYRILNRSQLKVNTRWLRREEGSMLPELLIRTGRGAEHSYDRPSRRSIMETATAMWTQDWMGMQ